MDFGEKKRGLQIRISLFVTALGNIICKEQIRVTVVSPLQENAHKCNYQIRVTFIRNNAQTNNSIFICVYFLTSFGACFSLFSLSDL